MKNVDEKILIFKSLTFFPGNPNKNINTNMKIIKYERKKI